MGLFFHHALDPYHTFGEVLLGVSTLAAKKGSSLLDLGTYNSDSLCIYLRPEGTFKTTVSTLCHDDRFRQEILAMDDLGVKAVFVAICLAAHTCKDIRVMASELSCRSMHVVWNVDCYLMVYCFPHHGLPWREITLLEHVFTSFLIFISNTPSCLWYLPVTNLPSHLSHRFQVVHVVHVKRWRLHVTSMYTKLTSLSHYPCPIIQTRYLKNLKLQWKVLQKSL